MKRSTKRILTTHGGRLPDPGTAGAFHEARASGDDSRAAGDRVCRCLSRGQAG
jgi:hypothetical protein